MKKILCLLLAALMLCLAASAESDTQVLEGVVLEISEEGYLIQTEDDGEVLALCSEDTALELSREIEIGDYIFVDFNGQMTRSIPAQVAAQAVRMYILSGEVLEISEDGCSVLLGTETHGEIQVYLPEGISIDGAQYLSVYFNGAMTLSIPAQVCAAYVVPSYALQGTITEISEEYCLIDSDSRPIQVNCAEIPLPENAKVGDVIRVLYNGQMTRSIPAQIAAQEIIQVSR